ncbi:MAG: mechanosensitive ion channel family protein [Pantoea sp.]
MYQHLKELLLEPELWLRLITVLVGTVVIYIVIRSILRFVTHRITRYVEGRNSRVMGVVGEILHNTSRILLFIFSFLIALKMVELPDSWRDAVAHGWFLALIFQFSLWIDSGIRLWLQRLLHDPLNVRNPVTTVIIGILIRVMLWVVTFLAILSNMGIDITALVASLGVGGIAIALAIQTVLSDVFASLAIGFDKPFEHGDFIIFGNIAGTIEHIGLKTTRLRSLSGEQIICSNTILLQQTIHNYKRMQQRRIVFKFGISYETPAKKVSQVGELVKEIISGNPDTRFDRAHFFAFEDSKLTFEVVYLVLTSDYNKYMDIQQDINLKIMAALEERDIRFAFPVRRIEFVDKGVPNSFVSERGSAEDEKCVNDTQARI